MYLEALKNRTTRTMSRIFNSVVPFPSTIITNKWTSYNFLDDNHEHLQCEKHMAFSHSIEDPYDHIRFCGEKISVHADTIEGFWSEFRATLHWSRGWDANYLKYILSEFMFRKAGYDLVVALQAR